MRSLRLMFAEGWLSHSFVRFALVGGANTFVGYGVILFSHMVLGLGVVVANVFGYFVGALLSYVLNRAFTFSSDLAHMRAVPRFILTVFACFLLNLLVLRIGMEVFLLPMFASQIFAMISYTLAFYLVSRSFVFRQ